MAQAQRILSSAVYAVEGVSLPFLTVPQGSTPTGASLSPKIGAPLPKKYVLRFRDGIWIATNIDDARVFSNPPNSAANLCARILVVLISGLGLRRTILDVRRKDPTGYVCNLQDRSATQSAAVPGDTRDDEESQEFPKGNQQSKETERKTSGRREASNGSQQFERRCPDSKAVNMQPASVGEDAGARRAVGDPPSSFLYRSMVEQVPHARFQGIQKAHPEIGLEELILFAGPSGSTMALPASQISAERVREAIEKSELEFAKGAA
jgi:hypothetical protein